MPYNLLHESWLPVRRESGASAHVTPWQITEGLDRDPITELAAPRPDFDGALIQFLIGLVQTAYAPKTERDWRRGLTNPPSPEALREAFIKYEHAFNLDGDGPRFLQDLEADLDVDPQPIANLLIDSARGKTLREHRDHFVKERIGEKYGEAATTMALLTMQTNAPSGGSGHRTSLRGGGPLCTLVLGQTLWQTVWLNVLSGELQAVGNTADDEAKVFPWLASTRTSEKGSPTRTTTPEDVHPLQCYWGMPRRISLHAASPNGHCALLDKEVERTYETFEMKSHGVNYEGGWRHPLTPYRLQKSNADLPLKGQPGGYSYRHWPHIATTSGSAQGVEAAQVVRAFHQRTLRYHGLDDIFQAQLRLWTFGFDTDNMKVRSWNESIMPLIVVPDALRASFEDTAMAYVEVAEYAVDEIHEALKRGLFGSYRKKDGKLTWDVPDRVSTDRTTFETAEAQFWQDTEAAFYHALGEVREHLKAEESLVSLNKEWVKALRAASVSIFDRITQYGTFRVADPKAVAMARRALQHHVSPYGRTVQKMLGLPDN